MNKSTTQKLTIYNLDETQMNFIKLLTYRTNSSYSDIMKFVLWKYMESNPISERAKNDFCEAFNLSEEEREKLKHL